MSIPALNALPSPFRKLTGATRPARVLADIPALRLAAILIFTVGVTSCREVSYLESDELVRLLSYVVLNLYLLDLLKVFGHEFQFYEFVGGEL